MKNLKIILRFVIIVLILFSCEKDENSLLNRIDYDFSFPVDIRPQALAINRVSGFIYVANHNPSIHDYSTKIQKYNTKGSLISTVADFSSFDQGKYPRYKPVDICIGDNQYLFVLVIPLEPLQDNSWSPMEGICILKFNSDDGFIKEYDLTQLNEPWYYAALSYSEKYMYVANGLGIKKIPEDNNQPIENIAFPAEISEGIPITDMAIDPEGCFVLTGQIVPAYDDASGCYLTKFDPSNNQVTVTYSTGRTGIMAAMLNNPGLTIDGNGNIYLVTFYGMGLEIFNKNGKFIMQTDIKTGNAEDTRPIDVALLNNEIYILDNLNNQILVYKQH